MYIPSAIPGRYNKKKNAMQDINRRDKVVKGGAAAAQQEQNKSSSSRSRSKTTKKMRPKAPNNQAFKKVIASLANLANLPKPPHRTVLTVSELF
jgi:hypothetical protein